MFFALYMDVARGSLLRSSHILRFPKWMRTKTARRTDHGQHLIWKTRTHFGNDILWLSALLVSFVCPFPWGLWDVVRFWWYDFRAPKNPADVPRFVVSCHCHFVSLQVSITDILENYRKHPAFLAIRICMNFPGRWNCLQVASRSHSTLGSTCGSTQRGSGIFPLGIVAKWKFFSKSERCISQHLHHVLWCDSVFNSRLAYLWEFGEENLKTCVTFKFGSLRFNIMNWRRRRGIWHHAKGVKCNLQLKTYPDPFYKV